MSISDNWDLLFKQKRVRDKEVYEERDEDYALVVWKLLVPFSHLQDLAETREACGDKHGSQYVSALLSVPVGSPIGHVLYYRRRCLFY